MWSISSVIILYSLTFCATASVGQEEEIMSTIDDEMAYVPTGWFIMGKNDGQKCAWGDQWDFVLINSQESGLVKLLPADSIPESASPYGVLDMMGNAAEWVADYFDFDYYKVAPVYNQQGPNIVMDHTIRGGSYWSPAYLVTTYTRDSSHSARPNPRVGFRCAKSAN